MNTGQIESAFRDFASAAYASADKLDSIAVEACKSQAIDQIALLVMEGRAIRARVHRIANRLNITGDWRVPI